MKGNLPMPGLTTSARISCAAVLVLSFFSVGYAQSNSAAQTSNSGTLPAAPQVVTTPAPNLEHYTPEHYSKSVKPFPDLVAPYKPRHVPEPDLKNAPRIDQL